MIWIKLVQEAQFDLRWRFVLFSSLHMVANPNFMIFIIGSLQLDICTGFPGDSLTTN